jgi:hypothetical protein
VSPDEARRLLEFHSNPEPDDPRWSESFLASLRPFDRLREAAFHEVMECIVTLAPELSADKLDRTTVSSLWGMCHFALAWGVSEDGMLRRNGLINDDDTALLARWVECISYATTLLLDGISVDQALELYRDYKKSYGEPG